MIGARTTLTAALKQRGVALSTRVGLILAADGIETPDALLAAYQGERLPGQSKGRPLVARESLTPSQHDGIRWALSKYFGREIAKPTTTETTDT